jgi:hypothetical protein
MSVIVTLQAVQFCFDWIAATVVAVNWCYTFKMSFPQYSETTLGWSLYTLFLLCFLPLLKSAVLDRLESDDKKDGKLTLQGWRYLLSITCGTAVGTAMTGLVALTFPGLSSETVLGRCPTGLFMAGTITLCFTMLQSCMEWLYHIGLPSYSKSGWLKSVLTILLCSTWPTMGYIWYGVWDKELTIFDEWVSTQYDSLFNITDTPVSRQLSPRIPPTLRGRQPATASKFQTINALMFNEDTIDDPIVAMESRVYKAVLATAVAVTLLYLMPDQPPVDDRRWLRRRLRLSAQMITLTVASYATTDMGYGFGTDFVYALTGSKVWGLVVAYMYAVLLSCIVCTISCVFRFRTQTQFQKWLFLLACYDVSFAWWYVWQETLYEIQGYGLTDIQGEWYADWVDFALAILQNLLMTLLWVMCIKWVSKFAVRKAKEMRTPDVEQDLGSTLNGDSITDSFRFLAACSGLDLGSVTALRQDDGSRYRADAAAGGADVACDGGAA